MTNHPRSPRAKKMSAAFIKGARSGWMRACVFYMSLDAERADSPFTKDMNERWPLKRVSRKAVKPKK